jgi:hypothetical protein
MTAHLAACAASCIFAHDGMPLSATNRILDVMSSLSNIRSRRCVLILRSAGLCPNGAPVCGSPGHLSVQPVFRRGSECHTRHQLSRPLGTNRVSDTGGQGIHTTSCLTVTLADVRGERRSHVNGTSRAPNRLEESRPVPVSPSRSAAGAASDEDCDCVRAIESFSVTAAEGCAGRRASFGDDRGIELSLESNDGPL